MNVKTSVIFGIATFAISIAGVIGIGINKYIQDSIQKGVQKEVCENMLETQNKAIQAQSIDTATLQAYKENQDVMLDNLKKKYDAISLSDTSNKAKLKGVEHAIDVFYANPP